MNTELKLLKELKSKTEKISESDFFGEKGGSFRLKTENFSLYFNHLKNGNVSFRYSYKDTSNQMIEGEIKGEELKVKEISTDDYNEFTIKDYICKPSTCSFLENINELLSIERIKEEIGRIKNFNIVEDKEILFKKISELEENTSNIEGSLHYENKDKAGNFEKLTLKKKDSELEVEVLGNEKIKGRERVDVYQILPGELTGVFTKGNKQFWFNQRTNGFKVNYTNNKNSLKVETREFKKNGKKDSCYEVEVNNIKGEINKDKILSFYEEVSPEEILDNTNYLVEKNFEEDLEK